MYRELDLIDVWFDSGAMPYAQFHYPFEKGDHLADYFPADFIAEGVDQTRGWFFYAACHSNNGFRLHSFQNLCFPMAWFSIKMAIRCRSALAML